MWDFETCTLLVERIGTNNVSDMFPARNWTLDWMTQHCNDRFGVTPYVVRSDSCMAQRSLAL